MIRIPGLWRLDRAVRRARRRHEPRLEALGRMVLGRQADPNGIGGARVPRRHRPHLRHSFAQQGEDLVLDRVLSRVLGRDLRAPGTYADIGAYHPVAHSVTCLLDLRGWTGLVADPSEASIAAFRRHRPRARAVRCVVGAQDGVEVDFHVPAWHGDGLSLIGSKYPQPGISHRQIRVVERTLPSLLAEARIGRLDVLNVDVEGAELEVLSAAGLEQLRPAVIAVEIHAGSLAEALGTEVARLLAAAGYCCVAACVITFFFVRAPEAD